MGENWYEMSENWYELWITRLKNEVAALHQRKGELEQAISRVRALPSYDGFLKIRMQSGMLTMAGPWVRLDDIKTALDIPPKF